MVHFISVVWDFVMHLDVHLLQLFTDYGGITYLILFAIIFCETGLVVTPFLPGDSLIFAAGALASIAAASTADGHAGNIFILFFVLFAAAVLGNTTNYILGRVIGQKIYNKEKHRFIKKESLDSTMAFFEKHGPVTIIVTRFMPIIRTFTPFVSGIAKMKAATFTVFNMLGGFLWVVLFLAAGHFFGQIKFVSQHISMIMVGIVVISLLPAIIGKIVSMMKKRKAAQ